MQNSPEFQRALHEAAERAHREFLYGGVGPKARSKDEIGVAMEEIQRRRKELEDQTGFEESLREAAVLERQANTLKRAAMAKAAERGIVMPSFPSLPKERTPESMEQYRSDVNTRVETIRKEHERKTNPHMREIDAMYKRKHGSSGLVCPMCGEGDHGNRNNNKPVCMMNAKHKGLGSIPLMTPEKAKEWKPPKKPDKVRSYTFNEVEGVTRK